MSVPATSGRSPFPQVYRAAGTIRGAAHRRPRGCGPAELTISVQITLSGPASPGLTSRILEEIQELAERMHGFGVVLNPVVDLPAPEAAPAGSGASEQSWVSEESWPPGQSWAPEESWPPEEPWSPDPRRSQGLVAGAYRAGAPLTELVGAPVPAAGDPAADRALVTEVPAAGGDPPSGAAEAGAPGAPCAWLRVLPAARSVLLDGDQVQLTRREFDLLLFLCQHRRRVFSREQLLTHVWGYEWTGGSRTVDVHIRRLRMKLGSEIVSTVHGVGYRIDDQVRVTVEDEIGPLPEPSVKVGSASADSAAHRPAGVAVVS